MGWQLLGAIGLLLIVGGVVGGGIKLVGVGELPVLRSRFAVVVCVAAGLAFLGMGYVTWREQPPAPSPQNPVVAIVGGAMDVIDRIILVLHPNDQTITLSPATGGAGTKIAVAGRGFYPGELVEVRFQAVLVATVTTDKSGSFATSFLLPDMMARFHGAPLAVTASGRSSVRSADATFTVQ
jgi:hypothetical protein